MVVTDDSGGFNRVLTDDSWGCNMVKTKATPVVVTWSSLTTLVVCNVVVVVTDNSCGCNMVVTDDNFTTH
jgi:hypothetical protein